MSQLSENTLNKIKSLFIQETSAKITNVRFKLSQCYAGEDREEHFKEIFIVFHSLKGTAKSIGFEDITDVAAEALAITQKFIDHQMSFKLFKAKIEAVLCEIEEILPPYFAETCDEEIITEKTLGKVLVVDDDISLTRAIKERLALDGYEVLTANSLSEAAKYIDSGISIDLMILDIIMPGGSGFELCQSVRKEKNNEETPIIFLTAESSLDQKLRSFEIGADDYMTKPILLDEIAAKVGASVKRTRNFKNRLLHDELTGAYNRSFLEEKFYEEKARSLRCGKTFCFCLLDLDCFKNVNDTYGHQAGDQVLIQFVAFLKYQLRPTDTLLRFGGEEFIILLPQTELSQAVKILERMRASFAAQVFNFNGNTFSITFSAGVATFVEDGNTLQELLASADKALYQAKHSGRDKICYFKRS